MSAYEVRCRLNDLDQSAFSRRPALSTSNYRRGQPARTIAGLAHLKQRNRAAAPLRSTATPARHQNGPPRLIRDQTGGTFWFNLKKLSGSYLRFSALSFSYFSGP